MKGKIDMKKLLCLMLSIFLLVTIVGCESNNDDLNDKETDHAEQVVGNYMTFEELLDRASDVIMGTCIGVDEYDSYKEYKFDVEKRFWGSGTEDLIYVYVPNRSVTVLDTEITYDLYDIVYEENESYFLVLTRTVDVYLDHDRYMNVGANIYLPANDAESLQMYGQSIMDHSSLSMSGNNARENNLASYFTSYDRSNVAEYSGVDYIKANDDSTIIKSSDFVLMVKIVNEVYAGIADDRNTYDCTVISAYKGNVETGSTVRIVFPKDAVVIGEEYILALYEFENVMPRSFVFSSKNSLFNVNEEDTIMQYINSEVE